MSDVVGEGRTLKCSRISRLGPGVLVTAAFIGPGTVVTASLAGAKYGSVLLWPIAISVVATIVLQSFAARIGILTGDGLGEAIRSLLKTSPWLRPITALIITALGIGNAAYQTGNIAGAASGLVDLAGGNRTAWSASIVVLSLLLVTLREYRWLQRILIALVMALSVTFLVTASFSLARAIPNGILDLPRLDSHTLTLTLALIGTTIVPYNLFLHASSAASNWRGVETKAALRESFWDTLVSVLGGGLVTAAILLTANAGFFMQGVELDSVSSIARQLTPTLGSSAGYFFSAGLFAAGLTSAVTAPLATSYAVSGVLGWQARLGDWRFRAVAYAVILVGGTLAMTLGKTPIQIIVFAQLANGLLLPVAACLLVWMSFKTWPGQSSTWPIALGCLIACFVSFLAAIKLLQLLGVL